MNLAKNTFSLALERQPSTYSIYKRIANLVLVIAAAVICINLWLLSTDQARNWHAKQANQLGRSLSQQAALSLAPALTEQNKESVSQYLAYLVQDPHVSSAAVFGPKGQALDITQANLSLLTNFRLRQKLPLVFVQEIVFDDKIRGYLRISLDEGQVMRYHDEYQRQLFEQMFVLMLLSGVAGLLVMRAFYKFRYRHYQKPTQEKTDA